MRAQEILADVRDRFREAVSSRESAEPGWLGRLRKSALERFIEKGFPTTADEEWRFTSVAPIASSSFELAGEGDEAGAKRLLAGLGLGTMKRHELVFVNGRLSPSLCSPGDLPEGVEVTGLGRVMSEHPERLEQALSASEDESTAFADWNRAFFGDGAFIRIGKGVVVDSPIHLVFLSLPGPSPVVIHPRNVILAEPSSQARIIETYAGADRASYLTNVVSRILVGDGAVVDHYKVQREGLSAFHVASVDLVQDRSATLADTSLSLGARLARNDLRAVLEGEGADLTLNGLYVVKDEQHVDHHTLIDHREPHGTSRELYKGVLDDAASGVFNGRIVVRPGAQKTDSRQSNKNLLLSRDAVVNTNPQLEIHADDVKCAHGATIGQLEEEALFYLRSRGIALAQARRILTEGFIADVSDRIRITALRAALRDLLFEKAA